MFGGDRELEMYWIFPVKIGLERIVSIPKSQHTSVEGWRMKYVIKEKFWSWKDSYGIEIKDGKDDLAILCAVIVIDQVLNDDLTGSKLQ